MPMRSLSSLVRGNLSLKIASFVLAVFVWMYVRSEEKPAQVFSLPIEFEGLSSDYALAGDVPDSVAVRVRAPELTLRNLSPGRFHARVRLDEMQPGEVSIPLGSDSIRGPLGVEIEHVEPQAISLRIEKRTSRQVPVMARIKGKPASGFEYDGYSLSPDRATVEGPESVVQKVREAITEEVSLDGRTESFDAVVGVVPDRAGARVVADDATTLRVNIRKKRETRSYAGVEVVPSLPPGMKYQVRFTPRIVTVVLDGTAQDLGAIRAEDIKAVLDLEGMNPREPAYAVKPRVTIAPGDLGARVAVHSVSEATINVVISQ